jgi:predicted TIM-barrel fold metal-dependent hydrolase
MSFFFKRIAICNRLKDKPTNYLKRLYFDAISYSKPALDSLLGFVDSDNIMFGTDNPFFPPLHESDILNAKWPSTFKVYETLATLPVSMQNKIKFENAQKIFRI